MQEAVLLSKRAHGSGPRTLWHVLTACAFFAAACVSLVSVALELSGTAATVPRF